MHPALKVTLVYVSGYSLSLLARVAAPARLTVDIHRSGITRFLPLNRVLFWLLVTATVAVTTAMLVRAMAKDLRL